MAGPGMHVPEPQTSLLVHAFPSLQGAVLLVYVHPLTGLQKSFVQTLLSEHAPLSPVWTQPVPGLQVSTVQGMPSSHVGGGPPTHVDPLHESPAVQGLPSVQFPGSSIVVICWAVLFEGLRSDEALDTEAVAVMSPLPAHWLTFTT